MVTKRETALVCAILILANSAFTPGQYLFDLGFLHRVVVNIAVTLAFLGWIWLALPAALIVGLTRNYPWYWVLQAFFVPVAAAYVVTLALVMDPLGGWSWALWMFLVVTANVALATFLMTFFLETHIRGVIFPILGEVPIWRPVQIEKCRLQAELPDAVRGAVQHMAAENQYVRVRTEAGEALLRMSLTEAAERAEPKAGLRAHRSHWVRKDAIEALKFDRGNPRLQLKDGTNVPVSRRTVDEIRQILAES